MRISEYQAALALTECGPILVDFYHPGFVGLSERGLVKASPAKGRPGAVIYRLKPGFSMRRAA